MSNADRSRWTIQKFKLGEEPIGNDWTLHLSPAERFEALWQLIVDGVAFANAGRKARGLPPELSVDESEFRRDIVTVIRRGG